MGSSSDWTWLPNELVKLILDKLIIFSDHVRFGAVCKSWRSVALHMKQTRKEAWPPMLLVPNGDDSGGRLYSVSEDKIYYCCIPVPYSKKCCGSSFGWLAKAEDDLAITLISPFSGKTICFPPITEVPRIIRDEEFDPEYDDDSEFVFVPEFYIERFIFSDDPSLNPNDFVVAAIYSDIPRLAFIKSGDQSWSYLDKNLYPLKDVYFYKGELYVLDAYNALIKVVDIDDGPDYEIVVPRGCSSNSHKPYLVEASNGDLLLVRRLHWINEKNWIHFDTTVDFKVYRLMMHSKKKKVGEWVEINSLGDDALFLGDSHSMCVLASDFPNCQPNSIYYTDDRSERSPTLLYEPRDMGVFNLQEQRFGKHYTLDDSHNCYAPAVWIMPVFH